METFVKIVDRKPVEVSKDTTANGIDWAVGCTDFQGGDYGHGSRLYMSLDNLFSKIRINNQEIEGYNSVEFITGGDIELMEMRDILKGFVAVIEKATHYQDENSSANG